MAEYRDPTLAPGATPTPRTTATSPTPAHRGGMSRWIWIIGAAVVALILLFMLFGGGDEAAPVADDPAATTAPVDPAADPAAPATTPVE
jgi:hypothetical protein